MTEGSDRPLAEWRVEVQDEIVLLVTDESDESRRQKIVIGTVDATRDAIRKLERAVDKVEANRKARD